MSAEKFWNYWLKVTMILVLLAGILLILLSATGRTEFMDKEIYRTFLGVHKPGAGIQRMTNWMAGVTGAVMTGWGLSMFFLVSHAFKRREKWAWRSMFYPVLLWYLADSLVSAWFGAYFNVMANTVLFLQIMAPLLFLRQQFFGKPKITG